MNEQLQLNSEQAQTAAQPAKENKQKKKEKKPKKKKWMRFRHRVVRNVAFLILGPYSFFKYGVRVKRFRKQGKRSYLVLFNHQTAFDQFFVGMAFRGPIYYLASEDIFSKGFVSSLLRYLVAPIPIKKQTTDVKAIMNCLRVSREGGTIAIAPEGNRTYSGKTTAMLTSIAPLARKMGKPIALYRLEGGYGVHPRWSDVVRRGKMRGYVSRVIEPEEYATMTDAELFALIEKELYVNEAVADAKFRHKKSAEYLERAMYVCPDCGLSRFHSRHDRTTCLRCGLQLRYLPTKELEGTNKPFPFRFLADWYDYQTDFIRKLDLTPYEEKPLYTEEARYSHVIPYKKKEELAKNATILLYGNRIEVFDGKKALQTFAFDEASAVTVLGKNKCNIYLEGEIYQLKGDKHFNALKFVQIYHHYHNVKKGDPYGGLLGL